MSELPDFHMNPNPTQPAEINPFITVIIWVMFISILIIVLVILLNSRD